MGKLDINLEGYRIVAESLHRLRRFIRDRLRQIHGDEWETLGLAAACREHLEDRRERESALSWRLPEECDLLDYGGFADLLDIAAADERTIAPLVALVPSVDLLRARFLELEVIFNRIAYARPISESQLELAVSFGERIRKALADPSVPGTTSPPPTAEPTAALPRASAAPPPPTPAPPHPVPKPPNDSAAVPAQPDPLRPAAADAATARAGGGVSLPGRELTAAVAAGDSQRILGELYREITDVADGLWRSGTTADPPVWSAVRESSWYRDNFSSLGLKVVSDFYDLVGRCRQRSEGPEAMQEFLKASNFAQLLLSLRDFFKARLER